MSDRWASFDCYGTIVDWLSGMGAALSDVVGDDAPRLLDAYHRYEVRVERERPYRRYREVLVEALRRGAMEEDIELPAGREDVLVRAWPRLPLYEDVVPALRRLRDDGWKLAVLTNCDDDLFATTRERFPVELDLVVTAEQVGSYKPDIGHLRRFAERSGADEERWVHVACSWVHDIEPAARLGIHRVWVDRDRTGHDASIATAVIPDFVRLPETLTEIVERAGG